MPKGAVLCIAGLMKAYRATFNSWVKHLVEFNDLDVFLYLEKNTSWVDRDSRIVDKHDEEAYLRSKLGDRLKVIHWTNDDEALQQKRDEIMELVRMRTEGMKHTYGQDTVNEKLVYVPNPRHVVDQYVRLAMAAHHFSQHANFDTYDYVFRFRIDVGVRSPILLNQLPILGSHHLYIMKNWSHSVREIFVCEPKTFVNVCWLFVHEYATFTPKHFMDSLLIPEIQMGQFLRQHHYRLQSLNLHLDPTGVFLYCEGEPNFLQPETFELTDFPSDYTAKEMEILCQASNQQTFEQSWCRTTPKQQNDAIYNTLLNHQASEIQQTSDTYFILFVLFLSLFVAFVIMRYSVFSSTFLKKRAGTPATNW